MRNTILFLVLSLLSLNALAKTVKYDLTATKGKVNLSGKKEVDFALMLNHQIPAPTLEFTEGDEAEITVTNKTGEDEISIHWHGLLLDPYMDGVSYVNTPPIKDNQSFTFKFKLRQHGTYWYHSHTNLQEQKGLYGAIVIHPKEPKIKYDKDLVVVLSDWSDENATQILENLRKDGDYYLYKKGTMRSIFGAIEAGKLGNYLYNEWTRMGGMDYSDVGYDAFLINGKQESQGLVAHPGERIRIRIINAAASSYFYVSLANLPMKIISLDGTDINPTLANDFLIGMAETYDLLFEVPEHKNYELKATVQDGTGTTSTWIGMGEKVPAIQRAFPDMYGTMDHGAHGDHSQMDHAEMDHSKMDHSKMDHSKMDHSKMDHSKMDHSKMDHSKMDHSKMDHSKMDHSKMDHSKMDHSKMDHSKMDHSKMDHSKMDHSKMDHSKPSAEAEVIESFDVTHATALDKTAFPKETPTHDVKLVLDGDMERYVWHINGKAIHQDRNIIINPNEVVRFTFVNNTMMHHPMHLHGHFFRVLNKHGDKSPMKHTVDVAPHTTRVIEFYTNEPGEWMLHCHNLYHMKTGMSRVVKYSSFTPRKEIQQIQKDDPHLHDHLYTKTTLEAATNHAEAQLNLMNTWNELELRGELRDEGETDWEPEGDAFYKRWFNQNTHLLFGGTFVEEEAAVVAGLGYRLPFLIESRTFVDQKGRLRLDLEKRLQWTKNWHTDLDITLRQELKSEFEITLMYEPNWNWAAGLMFTEQSAGVGLRYQF